MNWGFPRTSEIYLGTLLLRFTSAYSLLMPAYSLAGSFTANLGLVFSLVQGISLLLFSVGAFFLILGFLTRITSLTVFLFLLTIHFALQGVTFSISQIVLFLVLMFLGPGQYSVDYRFFKTQVPENFT
jgi:uncharacterized membrane protein YphA (DoxX/SURF4 family)